LTSTGLGKALLLDDGPQRWEDVFRAERAEPQTDAVIAEWVDRMAGYAKAGHAFDLEENADRVRCVAAPIRDSSGKIVAAISVSSAIQYMEPDRMTEISGDVRATAAAVSELLGWTGRRRARLTGSRSE
jgi:DNA-binding IclR family transcriptional regulator